MIKQEVFCDGCGKKITSKQQGYASHITVTLSFMYSGIPNKYSLEVCSKECFDLATKNALEFIKEHVEKELVRE
jgi:hypothetical protein